MPTALTTATAQEDLLEASVSLAALTLLRHKESNAAALARLAVLTARYLNTLKLEPGTGEQQHDELHRAGKVLLDAAVVIGQLALTPWASTDGTLHARVSMLIEPARHYLSVMNQHHNPGNAVVPLPAPIAPPKPPVDTMVLSTLRPARDLSYIVTEPGYVDGMYQGRRRR